MKSGPQGKGRGWTESDRKARGKYQNAKVLIIAFKASTSVVLQTASDL